MHASRLLGTVILGFASVLPGQALTRYVAPTGGHSAPYTNWVTAATNIQAAVLAASPGDTVLVSNGTYRLTNTVSLLKDLTLRSVNGPAVTVIDGQGLVQCVNLGGGFNVVVDGFTVRRGLAEVGAGLYASGGLITNCVITDNHALVGTWQSGGGVGSWDFTTVKNCIISSNTASGSQGGGGIWFYEGGLVSECQLVGNQAGWGAGAAVGNAARLVNTLVRDNIASSLGGGIHIRDGTMGQRFIHCTISRNYAGWYGGINGGTTWTALNSIVYGNLSVNDSGVSSNYDTSSAAVFRYCDAGPQPEGPGNFAADPQFRDPAAADFHLHASSPCINTGTNSADLGTVVDLEGYPRVIGGRPDVGAYELTTTHYVAPGGGHVWPFLAWSNAAHDVQSAVDAAGAGDTVWVSNGTYAAAAQVSVGASIQLLSVNGAEATVLDGAGSHRVLAVTTSAVVEGFTVTRGFVPAGQTGAGLFMDNGATVRWSRITGNQATDYGGGVFFGGGGGALAWSVIWSNTAVNFQGGGVYARSNALLRNCLLYTNVANEGGGVFCYRGGAVENCTIRGNVSRSYPGGGVRFYEGYGVVRNSIVAENQASGSADFGYFNTDGTVEFTCTPLHAGPGNIANPPGFMAADDARLNWWSPCVHAGTNAVWMAGAVDLDGRARVIGTNVDMGAYELAAIHFVKPTGTPASPFSTWSTAATTIQAAVSVCSSGDWVVVTNGSYLSATEVMVTQQLTLTSVKGAEVTHSNGGGAHRCLHLQAACTVDGFTVTNGGLGGASGGAGILCEAGARVRNCVIAGNGQALQGGGVMLLHADAALEDCDIRGNVSSAHGGGVYASGGRLERCRLVDNVAGYGGGVTVAQTTLLRNCLMVSNYATYAGGAVYFDDSDGLLENCTLVHNTGDPGGGFYWTAGSFDPPNLVNCIVYNNAGGGYQGPNYFNALPEAWSNCCTIPAMGSGCVSADPRLGTDQRLTFASPCRDAGTNRAWSATGEDLDRHERIFNHTVDIGAYELPTIFVSKSGSHQPPFHAWAVAATNIQDAVEVASNGYLVVVTNGTYTPSTPVSVTRDVLLQSVNGPAVTAINGAGVRRGLYLAGAGVVDGFSITNGYHATQGGGVYCATGGTLRNCWVRRNTSGQYGGGIYIQSTGTVVQCIVAENQVTVHGGGVYLNGGGFLGNSLVLSNTAADAGGVYFYNGGEARNCLLAGNGSSDRAGGSHIYLKGLIENCTLSDNHAESFGGGLYAYAGGTIRNSIVYHNSSPLYPDHDGGTWFSSCTTPSNGTGCVTGDPRFLNRAGQDYRLSFESPCRNAGTEQAWMAGALDLYGDQRMWEGVPDIGAHEFPVLHVAPGGAAVAPYVTWSAAATNVLEAAALARSPCAILVSNGYYRLAGQITLTGHVRAVGVNGADVTTVDGQQQNRCFHLSGSNLLLEGFTITGGTNNDGGGVFLSRGPVVRSCVLASNRAVSGGGAMIMEAGRLDRCVVRDNHADFSGGGVYLLNGGELLNTLICSNVVDSDFSGTAGGVFIWNGSVRHCTVAHNRAKDEGGGLYCSSATRVDNSIIYHNSAPAGSNYYFHAATTFTNCNTAPSSGVQAVTGDPRFRQTMPGYYRLATNSPSLDQGLASAGVTNDLEGVWRPLDSDRDGVAAPDVGAYESINGLADSNTNGLLDGWETHYFGSPLSAADPWDDADDDGALNHEESTADTDPFSASSRLRVSGMAWDGESSWVVAVESTSTGRLYTVESSTNVMVAAGWQVTGHHDRRGTGGILLMREADLGGPQFERVWVEVP